MTIRNYTSNNSQKSSPLSQNAPRCPYCASILVALPSAVDMSYLLACPNACFVKIPNREHCINSLAGGE